MNSQTRPVCSICIANYNGRAFIDACLTSLRDQNCGFAFEIILHDDASSDDSVEYIKGNYPDIRLIHSEQNVGFCVANNRMAAVAQGDYILLLNNDAALFPDALTALHQAAEKLGCPAILGLPQYDFDSGELLDIGSLLDPFLNPVPNLDPQRGEVGLIMGSCLWIPKALWDEMGGFPEWFESIGEDLYLCCRARLAGYPVKALGFSGYRHRVGQSFGGGKAQGKRLSTTYRRRALSERNKTFVMALIYPALVLLFLLPWHIVLLLLEGTLLSLIRWNRDFLAAIYLPVVSALLNQRLQLSSLRCEIQGNKRTSSGCFASAFSPLPHKLTLLVRYGLPEVK